jgi:hypothetical protein
MRAVAWIAVGLVVASAGLAADDLNVQVDPRANLAAFRTFTIRNGTVASERPELDNPLFEKKLRTTMRLALTARGLNETTDGADLVVDFMVLGEDFSTSQRGLVRGMGPRPLRFTQGTLTIDLSRSGEATPVWRGVYRDDEMTGSKLLLKLPEDAKKLIAKYPQRPR